MARRAILLLGSCLLLADAAPAVQGKGLEALKASTAASSDLTGDDTNSSWFIEVNKGLCMGLTNAVHTSTAPAVQGLGLVADEMLSPVTGQIRAWIYGEQYQELGRRRQWGDYDTAASTWSYQELFASMIEETSSIGQQPTETNCLLTSLDRSSAWANQTSQIPYYLSSTVPAWSQQYAV